MTNALQPATATWNLEARREHDGQGFALIVAAMPAPPPMQWNGNHDIESEFPQPRFGVFRP
jgi:hypothetical protein